MSATAAAVAPTRWPVVSGEGPEALAAIGRADTALALWRRRLDPGLAAWADACPEADLPAARFETSAESARGAIAAALPTAKALAGDAADLAARFAAATGARALRVRLDVVRDDACRRWHLDRVTARLICAYRGAGTEFGVGVSGETPAEVRRLARGEVGVFRGALWPWAGESLVHRSPPMSPGAPARLLLVLDVAGACG